MFQIYLFHFPFSCQHFRLELKCLILLRHLHFLPSTSSVLISGSVAVSERSVKKVLGVYREIKLLQFYPKALWKAAARICSEVLELWFSRAEILWPIWLQCGCCKSHQRHESSHLGLLNTRSSFSGGKSSRGHRGTEDLLQVLELWGDDGSFGLVLLKPGGSTFLILALQVWELMWKNPSSVWDLAEFEGPERMGAFVVKFRDFKCEFWFGSLSFSGWEIAEPSLVWLAAWVPNPSIKCCLESDLGLGTEHSGSFMLSCRRWRQPVTSMGFRRCISSLFLGNPDFCRVILIPAGVSGLLMMSKPLSSTEMYFPIKTRPWSWFSGSCLPSWCTLVITGFTGLGSVFPSSWRSETGDKLYQCDSLDPVGRH